MQNAISRTNHDFVIKTVADFYSKDAIHDAKLLLFEKCSMTALRNKSYTKDAAKMDCRDIVIKLNEVGYNCPTFVAKDIAKLPLATPDAFDLAKISKDIADVLKVEEKVANSFSTLQCLQADFQMVLEKCAKIDNITTEVASLKLLLETKQSTHAMSDTIPAESEDDMNSSGDDTSENSENFDDDNGDDADGEDNGDDADDDDNGNDPDDDDNVTFEQTARTKVRRHGKQYPARSLSNRKQNADHHPVLRLNDRPPGLDPRMTEGDFKMVTNRKKLPSQQTYSDSVKNSAHRVFVNSTLHKQSPRNLLKTVKFNPGKNTNHNIGYSRNNSKQCEIFASRFVPETTPRDVVGFLKSKYDVNVQVMQMRTKFDAYTSFKITAPSYLKRDLLNRTNWISGTYVREFVGRLN